jgi:hypothetical protein
VKAIDLPAVEVRVIREVNDLEELIAGFTSPSFTVEKGEGVEPLAFVEIQDSRTIRKCS